MSIARWQSDCTIAMSWVTSTTVLPARRRSWNTSMHFCAEGGVADGEHLVDQHDVGVGLDHDREGEPDQHPGRVVLELEVDELLELGELEHGVEPAARLAQREAHQHAVEHAVLARGELGVEAHAELDERGDPARPSGRGRRRRGRCSRGSSAGCSCRSRCGRRSRRTRPRWTSKEMSRSARCSRYSMRVNGCAARSLSESMRCSGMRNDLSTPRASMTTGRSMAALSLTLDRPR